MIPSFDSGRGNLHYEPSMKRSHWLAFRSRLEWLGVRTLAEAAPLLPRGACKPVADFLGRVYFEADAASLRVVLANLEAAFGDRFTVEERLEIGLKSAQNLARTFLDLFWASRLTRDNYTEFMDLQNFEPQRWRDPEHPGLLMVCQHFGNFEWLSIAVGFTGTQTPFIEQEFKNPALGPIFDRAREVSGSPALPRQGAMLRVFKHLKSGGTVGLLPDLTLRPGRDSTAITFLGLPMSVTATPAALQAKLGCPIVPAVSRPRPDGTCELRFFEPIPIEKGTTIPVATQQLWDFFEPHVRETPHLWMWAYKHWRYRPSETTRAYPYYANVSRAFDKLLAQSGVKG